MTDQYIYCQSTINIIWHCVKKYKWQILIFQLLASVWVLEAVVGSSNTALLINAIEAGHGSITDKIIYFGVRGMIIWAILDIMFRLHYWINAKFVTPGLYYYCATTIIDVVLKNRMDFFMRTHSTAIAAKVMQVSQSVTMVVFLTLGNVIPTLVTVAVSSTYIWRIHYYFGITVTIALTLHCLVVIYFMPKINQDASECLNIDTEAVAKIADVFCNMKAVKAFASSQYESDYLYKAMHVSMVAKRKMMLRVEKMKSLFVILNFLLLCLCLYGQYFYCYATNKVSASDLSIALMLTNALIFAVWSSSDSIGLILQHYGLIGAGISALCTDLDSLEDLSPIDTNQVFADNGIVFENVSFSYRPNVPLFSGFNLTINPGEKIALVGVSGAGKTTLTSLLSRYFEADFGKIKIGGVDISTISHNTLRSNIAVIPQDCGLFNRSILENLTYGKRDASNSDITKVTSATLIDNFIYDQPEGLNTIITENGAKLSGGQRQRIAIARMLLKNAMIVILDEPTSALDACTEHLIKNAIYDIMADKTVITIAHRLETVVKMDRILIFSNGRIVEEGTHEELLQMNGYYAKMWSIREPHIIA